MASAREHLARAEQLLDTVNPTSTYSRIELARAHVDLARARVEVERLAWLGTAEELLGDRAVEDLELPSRCCISLDGVETHAVTCPDNDEGPAAATAGPSDA